MFVSLSLWSFIADIVKTPNDTPSSVVKVYFQTTNILGTEFKGLIPPTLNTATSKKICPQWESNPKRPAVRGEEIRGEK